jgi:dihydrofolate reductase
MTGRIVIDLFTTLDGVSQAPGGPDEDTSGGFRFGGWQAPLFDDTVGAQVGAGMQTMDALLLGRRTYDIFAGFWPQHTEGPDGEIGQLFDRLPKYVASRGEPQLDWTGTTQLGPDLAAEIARLRERHSEVHVIGSVDFVHTLLDEQLFDQLNLWVYPIALGEGRKVFPDGAVPRALRLISPPQASESGAVLLQYAPAGAPTTGDMSSEDRGA